MGAQGRVPARGTEAARLSVVQLVGDGRGGGHPSTVLIYLDAPSLKEQKHELVTWLNPRETIGFNAASLAHAHTLLCTCTVETHLIEIALWAIALLLCGEMATFETAFYVSAENYTALGYGDIVLSERWRLLGPLEAINGLLLFGLSTGVMFAVMGRLIANRVHLQLGQPGEAAVNPESGGSGSKRVTEPL